ncbi:hypothetical protein SESBI_42699 [Sesbania bispinosa]|nr:hypothetical protein SESBI_42699 [Sesbania bispinosa]
MDKIRNENDRNVEMRHKEQFHKWFENEVIRLQKLHDRRISNQLVALSRGPDCRVFNHNGYILNGFKFRTKDDEKHLNTQNSGVIVKGDELTGHIDYYGASSNSRNQGKGYKKDEYGFISVDITKLYYTNDLFILGSQAELVYYVKHSDKENWYTVVKVKPRNIFDLPDEDDSEPYQHNELGGTYGELEAPPVNQDEEILNRADINGLCLDGYVVNQEEESDNTSDVDTDDDQEESHIDESDEYSQNEDSDLE